MEGARRDKEDVIGVDVAVLGLYRGSLEQWEEIALDWDDDPTRIRQVDDV